MFNQYMEMYKVRFDGSKSFIDGALPVVKVELPFPPYLPAQRDCVALSNGSPWDDGKPAGKVCRDRGGAESRKYPHIKDVTGKMVMACPPFGDVPLWNAEQVRGKMVVMMRGPSCRGAVASVRGKMVAIMRGPSSQKPSVPFHIKMFHAQNAGAIGVVFINDIPQDKSFTAIPRVDSGAIQAPWGDGTQARVVADP
ncbi:hypothetical protein T484DRAFT_1798278 [Baffinella frigidus]|nr:hypothetical protein T484DRAFT_1798278 [Cryptophyta sp. CCMP2293]